MKKGLSLIMCIIMLFSVIGQCVVFADEDVSFKNKICTIETQDGTFLISSGADRGKALTVGEEAKEWRFKEFLGGSYSFVGEDSLAADVNSASKDEGVTIIQWTASGAGNQRWRLEKAEDGFYYIKSEFSNLYLSEKDGKITQEVKNEEFGQRWKVNVVGEFEPVVEKMLESDAAKSLSEYKYGRLYAYIMSGGEFNLLVYDKIEKMINERDYFNLSLEEQKAFVEECFTVVSTDLMYGSMATKLKRDISVEYVGIEKGAWQSWHGIPEEDPRLYNITITDKETGDSHVVQYISPYDDDEEYAAVVGEAIACFEMPVVKCLWRFVYTSMNTSSWNGGDGTIWNNTAYRGDVNNMVQMFAHELGHVMDNGRQDNNVWYRAIAQDMVPVTGYGNTNRWEDLAEFSRMYLLAKGDDLRIQAIENTYPARTVAYKALLYALDNEFYADYKDEYDKAVNAVGNYEKSEIVTLSTGGKYLTDKSGVLTLEDANEATADWQTWEIYTMGAGNSKVLNKATGKYLTFEDGKLTLGDGSDLGFKSTKGGYLIVQGSTGFAVDTTLTATLENSAVWTMKKVGDIPFAGKKYKIQDALTGYNLTYSENKLALTGGTYTAWYFIPVEKGWYQIEKGINEGDKVIDVSGNSVEEGAKAILYSVTGGTNQHFAIENNGDGTYSLVARHSLLKLGADEEGTYQGEGNRWIIEEVTDDGFILGTFSDVTKNTWYYDVVRTAYKRGWIDAERRSFLGADKFMTRAAFLYSLYKAAGRPESGECKFSDVTDFYKDAVAWANENGIVNGVDEEHFAPFEEVTREQAAAMFYRYAIYKGADVSVGENTNILSFVDFESVSEYAIPTMQWAVGSGLFKGTDKGELQPWKHITKAETAQLLIRMFDEIVNW